MPHAVTVEHLSKQFMLHDHRPHTIRESLTKLITGRLPRVTRLWALRDISLAVEQGTTFGVIGHNGAGKSTLLRCLCGLSRPTSGRIWTNGRVSGVLELGGGFNPNLTGRQNLMTAGLLNGLTPAQVRAREEKIIAFAELEKFIDKLTRTYSSGMYLRLAFAGAMEFEPAVLVLDEVLSVGDERFQRKCQDRITELKRAGTTLIFTSHSPEQVTTFCDEVLVLEEGRMVMHGDPQSALSSYHELLRQRTAARAAGMGTGDDAPAVSTGQGSRQGTLEAAITGVNLRDRDDRATTSVRVGQGVRIALSYRISQPINDLALLVGIYSESNVKCFETSINSMASTFGTLAADGTVVCSIKSMPLLPGKYFVNVGLYPTDWSFMYDYHWQMHSFQVTAPGERIDKPGGVVAMDVAWHSMGQGSS